jgi:CheY-like chemotaxis protein
VDVLVVDPGELGELLSTLLQQYGFSVERVDTGERALTQALGHKPAVVIVEAELPDTSGLDLAELFRDELQARTILTYPPSLAAADAGIPLRLQRLDGAFVRPFRSLSLIEAVARLLGRPLQRPGVGDAVSSLPLSSTEGYAIDELAEELGDGIEVILSDEVDVEVEAAAEFVLQDFDPGVHPAIGVADDHDSGDHDVTIPSARTSNSTEAARPLEEVLHEEERRQTQSFSPGDLADLWQRVKERRSITKQPARPATTGQLTPRLLADLLDAFHQSQTTGELWLGDERGAGRRVLLLQRGLIVGARSNIEGEDLVSLLRKRKAIADEDADDVAFMLSQKAFRTATEAVLSLEYVPEALLRSIVEEHVRRVAIGAFSWMRGRYHLTLEGRATKEVVRTEVNVGDVVVHAIILTEGDEGLRRAAPDDARFAPVGDAVYGLEHLKLSPAEARVVIAMDGTKTIADLITLHAPIPERTIRGLAAGLFCLSLTRFLGRGPAAARKISFF